MINPELIPDRKDIRPAVNTRSDVPAGDPHFSSRKLLETLQQERQGLEKPHMAYLPHLGIPAVRAFLISELELGTKSQIFGCNDAARQDVYNALAGRILIIDTCLRDYLDEGGNWQSGYQDASDKTNQLSTEGPKSREDGKRLRECLLSEETPLSPGAKSTGAMLRKYLESDDELLLEICRDVRKGLIVERLNLAFPEVARRAPFNAAWWTQTGTFNLFWTVSQIRHPTVEENIGPFLKETPKLKELAPFFIKPAIMCTATIGLFSAVGLSMPLVHSALTVAAVSGLGLVGWINGSRFHSAHRYLSGILKRMTNEKD